MKGFPQKKTQTKKSTAPKKSFAEVVSKKKRARRPREPPTTTIFGDVGISIGVEQYFNPFAWKIRQFLDVAA